MLQDKAQPAGNVWHYQGRQRCIEASAKLPLGEPISHCPRCCASWKGRVIPSETRLARNGFSAR